MSSSTVDVAYKLDLTQLKRSLATIPGLTAGELKAAVTEVSKASRQLQREAAAGAREAIAAAQEAARAQATAAAEVERRYVALQRAQMTASQRAQAEVADEIAALDRLSAAGADAARVATLRAAAVEQGAARVAAALARERAAGGGALAGAAPGDVANFARAAEQAGVATWQVNNAAASLRRNIGDVTNSLIAGQAPLTVLLQQGPQIAEVFATGGSAGGLLKASLGGIASAAAAAAPIIAALTIAVGAGAAVYSTYANRSEALAEATGRVDARLRETSASFERAKTAAVEARAAWAGFQASAAELEDELAVAMGTATRAAVEYRGTVRKLEEEARADILATARVVTEAEAVRDAAVATRRRAELTGDREAMAAAEAQVQSAHRAALIARGDLETKQAAVAAARETADNIRLVAEAEEAAAARATARGQAQQRAADAARAALAALRAEQERADALRRSEATALAQRTAQVQALAQVELQTLADRAARTGELADLQASVDAATAARQAELAAAADRALAAGVDAATIERAYLDAAREAELQGQAQIEAARAAAHAAEVQRIEERQRLAVAGATRTASTLIDIAATVAATELAMRGRRAQELRSILEENEESLSRAQRARIEGALAAEQAAAVKAFRAQQTAQISASTMAAATAVMQGYAQLGPIGGSVFAGAAAGLLAAQVAQISRQQPPVYDLGGMVPMPTQAQRHTPIMAEAGEAVLTRRGVDALGGPDGVREANEGGRAAGGAGPVSVALTLRHRTLERVMVEHAGRGGTGRVSRPSRLNPYSGIAR